MSKLVGSLKEAIRLSGLKDGMTICFHHHLRNGDMVFDMAMGAIRELGIRDLRLVISSVFDCDTLFVECIKEGVITAVDTNYMSGGIGKQMAGLPLKRPIQFRSHGHYDAVISTGEVPIDLAILGAPTCDCMGNFTGRLGPSACGALGYAFTPAQHARKVIAVTDNLVPYPLSVISISEVYVDYVVKVDKIGESSGIVSGITRMTKDPVGLQIGRTVCKVIEHSGLLKDGFSFQTGGGSISLAAAQFLKEIMIKKQVHGSFIMGGVTQFSVELLRAGCFDTLFDTQCMDLVAVESLEKDRNHLEVTNGHYASPASRSCIVENLDVAVLGATEIDEDFNVNVHTDSNGYIMGGSGGHSDIAACNKLAIVVAPLWRARLPVVREKVTCCSTPGSTVDVFVSQLGVAVNPKHPELKERLKEAGIRVKDIRELKAMAEKYTGVPKPLQFADEVLADVLYRDGSRIDQIRAVAE